MNSPPKSQVHFNSSLLQPDFLWSSRHRQTWTNFLLNPMYTASMGRQFASVTDWPTMYLRHLLWNGAVPRYTRYKSKAFRNSFRKCSTILTLKQYVQSYQVGQRRDLLIFILFFWKYRLETSLPVLFFFFKLIISMTSNQSQQQKSFIQVALLKIEPNTRPGRRVRKGRWKGSCVWWGPIG